MTVLESVQRYISWALFQRSKLSMSSNNAEINASFFEIASFSKNFLRHSKETCKNHRKKFPILTKIELVSEDTQFRHHLKFQGNRTKSSIILAIMNFFSKLLLVKHRKGEKREALFKSL